MVKPIFEDAKILCESNTIIPISTEIFADVKTSIEVLKILLSNSEKCYLLESVVNGKSWGRYSFLGYKPKLSITCNDGNLKIIENTTKEIKTDSPFLELKKILKKYKSPKLDYLPPFTGGLVGYFSYDCIKYSDMNLKLENDNPHNFDDFNLMLFDKVIAFDHLKQKIFLIVNIETNDFENNYTKGVQILKEMEKLILNGNSNINQNGKLLSELKPIFDQSQFCEIVEKTKKHIECGDIYQAVLSNRFDAKFEGSLLQTFRYLRTTNPSPYMFYMNFGDIEIAGSSPETLSSLKNGILTSYALAGTCKRGITEDEDNKLIEELLKNEKELSEHDMLVDLGLNDLGKISEFGSVKVSEYRKILKFSHVSHIASVITSKVADNIDQFDILNSILPAGTLSGSPKKKSCEIINDLEKTKRGAYGGAIGYIDFTGNMDMCIGIRMAKKQNGNVFVQAGAGIVADSDPIKEYNETINKSQAIINALKLSQEV